MSRFVALLLAFTFSLASISLASGTPPMLKELISFYPFEDVPYVIGPFDVAHGVKNAIALDQWHTASTMYMRTLTDTANSFTWPNGVPIAIGDFNGDSFTDYWMLFGGIVPGVGKGVPPDTTHIAPSSKISYTPRVFDIDNDGKDDLVIAEGVIQNDTVALVAMGNSDLASMKTIALKAPTRNPVYYKYSPISYRFIKIYRKGIDNRIVWAELAGGGTLDEHYVFNLGRIESNGDTARIVRISSREIGPKGTGEDGRGYVYYNRRTQEATFMMQGGHAGTGIANEGIRVFSLDNDEFEFIKQIPELYAAVFLYDQSYGEPYNEGWGAIGDTDDSIPKTYCFMFNGSPRTAVARAIVANGAYSAGDLNGDNIADYWGGVGGRLIFYDGALLATDVKQDTPPHLELYPNPTTHLVRVQSQKLLEPGARIICTSIESQQTITITGTMYSLAGDTASIDVSSLATGAYLLTITSAQDSDVFKLIINR